jgi:DNA-binding PadR family transcriptional regulator
MGFPVLSDINWKLELKKIDMAISRSVQQAVLLITQGSEEIGPPTKENQDALRKIFEGGSVGKVLIADFTTKAEFIIPQIGDILDPKKYEIVDRDIRFGLNNILFGEDKFANSTTKMDAFLKRIELARVDFMDNFFKPQVKEIAKLMGFKSAPTPKWKNLNLKDNSAVLSRVYTRLLELGAISPEDAITAITENRLPDADELKESQTKLKQDLKDGFYVPLLNNGKEAPGEAGRPGGKGGSPQKSQKITPIGKKAAASFGFGIQAIASNINKVAEFEKRALLFAKSEYKVKKLTEGQQSLVSELVDIIISSESPQDWDKALPAYFKNPAQKQTERYFQILEIGAEHNKSFREASILFDSKIEKVEETEGDN